MSTEIHAHDTAPATRDTLQKFMFENAAVRGEFVDVSATWRHAQEHHAYPPAVRTLLGEMLAAAALLSANLKFNGVIVMQIHGDGPVRLLVVECDAQLHMRATAKLAPDAVIADDASMAQLLNAHGMGRFVITLDPQDKMPGQQAYQGVVPLDGDSMAVVIENYMMRSEQLDTRLWLAADTGVSRGLLLQKLPDSGGKADLFAQQAEAMAQANAPAGAFDPDADPLATWDRVVMLGSTLRKQEMLETDIGTLMRRLFWEETIRVFDPLHPKFQCSCSREKVGNMLKMLGKPEVDSALDEMETLAINCDFCAKTYEFDRVDCAQLFAADAMGMEGMMPLTDVKH